MGGFVHYETEGAARQAIEHVSGTQIGEKTVQVCPFVKRIDREKPDIVNFTNLYLKNLPAAWDCVERVQEALACFGPITSACLLSDHKDRKFALVNFEQPG